MSSSGPARFRPGPVAVGLAFLVHPLEEAATDFPLWFRATLGGDLDPVTFAIINTVGFFVITGAVGLHRRGGSRSGSAAAAMEVTEEEEALAREDGTAANVGAPPGPGPEGASAAGSVEAGVPAAGSVAAGVPAAGSLALVPAAVGALFLLNATIHVAAALMTAGYVPGLVTSLLVWAPMGVVLLREGRVAGRDSFRRGVAVGVAAQILVTGAALWL